MRLIDADALKEKLNRYEKFEISDGKTGTELGTDMNLVNEAIDDMPTIIGWIPVTEALPPIEKGVSDIVLITYHYPNEEEKLAMAYYRARHLDSLADGEWCTSYGCGLPATAWMPLPNAYKGEERNEAN